MISVILPMCRKPMIYENIGFSSSAFNMKEYKLGEKVRAKWPGSRLWYKAEILELLDDGYKVKFEDGTEDELEFADVARESRFTRRSRSRSKSPSRRRRSRSRSPARSPARTTKQKTEKKTPAKKTPAISQTKVVSSVTKRVVTKKAEETPAEPSQSKSVPRRLLTPTRTQTRTTEEHHTYTTRSTTRSGQQTLEPPTDISQRSSVPKTKHREFGGPIGVVVMMFLLPLIVYYLHFACTKGKCQLVLCPDFEKDWQKYFDLNAFLLVLGWIAFQIVIYFIPVGRIVQGLPLRTGKRLKYYENAFYALVLSLVSLGLLVYYKKPYTMVTDNYLAIITACMVLSVVLSVALYVKAKKAPSSELAPLGNSGNFFYDFFMGHELNPRIGMFDIKYFFELRPGMIGWVIIDHIFLFSEWTDFPEKAPLPLLLLTIFHTLYVADSLWHEVAILSTMDIISEGFGFMLAFGDLVWVPFVFSLQARYLSMYPAAMPDYCLGIIVVMNLFGYYIFRSANSEKNQFRKNPFSQDVAHLETITTSTGKSLIVSGWWGFVRRPNYLGDIIMAFSWALLCGFESCIPYFYPIYLTILLIHRERRDSNLCRQKYGRDWDIYCSRVPYRIIPYVY